MVTRHLRNDTEGNRSDDVYKQLREDIVTGVCRPNGRLIEVELADRLKVSRTPIREALKRLASEGLVLSRRRGWIVREHTGDEIREIYEARAALEGYCARLAAKRGTEAQLKHIASLHRGAKGTASSSRKRLVEVNESFHDAIITAAQNERLAELIHRNREYYFNFRIAKLYTDDEAQTSLEGHDAIVRALGERDGERAEREMRKHIDLALGLMLSKLS